MISHTMHTQPGLFQILVCQGRKVKVREFNRALNYQSIIILSVSSASFAELALLLPNSVPFVSRLAVLPSLDFLLFAFARQLTLHLHILHPSYSNKTNASDKTTDLDHNAIARSK